MAYKRTRKDFEADLQKQESPYVLYGTPLPPLDEHARDDGSYVPVWKQEVTDDRGRKRLHGAFTGGFSAGYFNTVGSKEGWAPSTFVSSRTNRAKDVRNQVHSKPEDFMDEEDIREQEEARNISTNEEYAGFGTADDVNHKNGLMDLFKPAEDTMGMKLLNKMGWKQGHGMGPKIRRKVDPNDEWSKVHLFAPDDVPMLSFTKKTDHKGLGAVGERESMLPRGQTNIPRHIRSSAESDEEDEGRPGLTFASRTKKTSKIKRGAFGVGILNDTGSDEEDPYSIGPKISHNKTLGGDKKSKKTKSALSSNANPLLKHKPVFISKKLSTISHALQKCHDGRLPLDGFVLANELDKLSTISINDDKYKPPPVPEGWQPSRASPTDLPFNTSPTQTTTEAAKASTHNSLTRGSLLGESALPGKSVFDYLTPAARDKLMKASGRTNLPPGLSESLPGTSASSFLQQDNSAIPSLDPQTALQALSRTLHGGFTPYPDSPTKAARYKAYLESQANISTNPSQPAPRPQTMTKEDYTIELHEFSRTAEVFKPVSGLIASRFTTSTSSTSSPNITATGTKAKDSTLADLLTNPTERPRDPAEEAAKVGMFGALTRSVTNFYPARLLCKRFGVTMPSHADTLRATESYGSGSGGTAGRFQGAEVYQDENNEVGSGSGAQTKTPVSQGAQLAIEGPDGTMDESSAPQDIVVNPDKNEALEQERPGAAVFRAIFGSDDEDED